MQRVRRVVPSLLVAVSCETSNGDASNSAGEALISVTSYVSPSGRTWYTVVG